MVYHERNPQKEATAHKPVFSDSISKFSKKADIELDQSDLDRSKSLLTIWPKACSRHSARKNTKEGYSVICGRDIPRRGVIYIREVVFTIQN
ncbi:hypothetical protein J6590_051599 [Homalodisca vitripennis]|nr:hypothetical protein J6590_051599 [Homalodisca vitripennis]